MDIQSKNHTFADVLQKSMPKLYIIVNEDRFFLSHRKDIALAAQEAGWDVTIVCKDTGQRNDVERLGLKMLELPINPTGTNLLQEYKTYRFLLSLYSKNRDAIVHHVGLKPILWGGLAAKVAGVKGVVNAVSGLGVMFSSDHLSPVVKGIVALLRYSHRRENVKVIFQNHEDEQLFLRNHIIKKEQSVFIKGSGVNLNEFQYTPQPDDPIAKVLFTGRMVKEKGVVVLIKAAQLLRKEYEGRLVFWLCGGLHNNPKALKEKELQKLCDGKYIQWLGFRNDVKELLEKSHIVAFPSYYREGVPKSLIEACAIGRPIITTDSIGCRDTVDDGINGFLVPAKDYHAVAERLKTLIDNRSLRESMAKASRLKAEKEFSLSSVINKHLQIYNTIAQ